MPAENLTTTAATTESELKLGARGKMLNRGTAVWLAHLICLGLIIGGECILTPVPLIYPENTSVGANSSVAGGGGWHPSPEFITPYPDFKLVQTKLGLNVTPVRRHVYDYSNESPYGVNYPPYNSNYNGNWPPVASPGPELVPGPIPGPVPAPGIGYQNYPYPPPPLAVRPPIPQELLLKTLLVPLTGAALLGVAAFLVSNPVLFKLGVIAGRRRRRRAIARELANHSYGQPDQTLADFLTLQRFMRQFPNEEAEMNRNKIMANYLSCSGLLASSRCLERLVCQAAQLDPASSRLEDKVIRIVVDEIVENTFVPQAVKRRVKKAQTVGLASNNCSHFVCTDLVS